MILNYSESKFHINLKKDRTNITRYRPFDTLVSDSLAMCVLASTLIFSVLLLRILVNKRGDVNTKEYQHVDRDELKQFVAEKSTVIKVTRANRDRIRRAVEWVLVLTELILTCLKFEKSKNWIVNVIFWCYCFGLLFVRRNNHENLYWYHSLGLYIVYSIVRFDVIASVLCLLMITDPMGDESIKVLVDKNRPPSIESVSSIWDQISFSFATPLIQRGYKQHLTADAIWSVRRGDNSEYQCDKFSTVGASSITIRLLKHFKWQIVSCFLCATVSSFAIYGPSIFVKVILDYVAQPGYDERIWFSVAGMFLISILGCIFQGQALYIGKRSGIQARSILINEIYAKAMRREMGDTDSGSVLTLMSVDTNQVSNVGDYLQNIVSSILQIVIAIVLLYQLLGWSTFAGVACIIAVIPVNFYFAGMFGKIQKEKVKIAENRLQKTSELLKTIRIVKYFVWESEFANKIQEFRKQELAILKKRYVYWALFGVVLSTTPVVISVATFACYTLIQGQELTSSVAFTALSIFNIMRTPADRLAYVFNIVIQAKVSLDRISTFLDRNESTKYDITEPAGSIKITNGYFKWTNFKLENINIECTKGLNLVIGPTGSGKTSLLLAMLGEMEMQSGSLQAPNSIAYCSQQPWLLNDTIQNNILFGCEYKEERYRKVIYACALDQDLKNMDDGDQTEIGERGITLSGGQKQRVSLARVVYSNAAHLLLDDCLSAVDGQTAKHLYDYCFNSELVDCRTVVLVTHTVLEIAKEQAVQVINVQSGKIESVYEGKNNDNAAFEPHLLKNMDKVKTVDQGSKLIKDERISQGAVASNLYWSYLSMLGSFWFLVILFFAYVLQRLSLISQSLWLRKWTTVDNSKSKSNVNFYIGIYTFIGMVSVLLHFAEQSLTFYGAIHASRQAFTKLLDNIISAPIQFFDTTPVGRILNRFSKDFEGMDLTIPPTLTDFSSSVVALIGTTILIAAITPEYLLIGALIAVCYWWVTKLYVTSTRELKRIEAVSRSSLFQHFDTLQGIVTIRAFGYQPHFQRNLLGKVDDTNRPFFYMWLMNRWLYFRVDAIGGLVSAAASAFIVMNKDTIDSGLAGVALSYAIEFNRSVLWAVRMYSTLEIGMNAIERIEEYCHLPAENSGTIESIINSGSVEFESVSMRYGKDLPLILENVSFKVEPHAKFAIIGRTGAGKSSIFNVLYRFNEIESGCVKIDGVDITTLTLEALRKSLAVIPQDPVLFAGTMRYNLDPFGEYSDESMFKALKRVELEDTNLYNLDYEIKENGQNISQGQRQLLCLARSLLREPKVLLMDEATASIDHETDAKIQHTLRNEFVDTTLITIAHRTDTIKDYDVILELENGKRIN